MPSKRYLKAQKIIDTNKLYSPEEAVDLIKKTSTVKFDAMVELHARLGIDPQKSEQQVKGIVTMPFSIGKTKKIAAFVDPAAENEAKEAGADIVGGEDLINEIKKNQKINFDIAIATPAIMPKLTTIAKILGPKGLMPSPKNETVTNKIKETINELRKGKITFKNDETGNVHAILGKVSLDARQLLENFNAFLTALKRAKPASAKGTFIKKLVLASTMGPAIKVQI